jgi:cell division septum initiation protein DivIVA
LEIKRIGFANHTLASAELVRFLTVNSGVEVSEQLELRIEKLEADLTAALKQLVSTDKACTSASNKADEARKANAALDKRVVKLE